MDPYYHLFLGSLGGRWGWGTWSRREPWDRSRRHDYHQDLRDRDDYNDRHGYGELI